MNIINFFLISVLILMMQMLFSCAMIKENYYNCIHPENALLNTGEKLACNENIVAIGTVSSGASGGFITVLEKANDKWNVVYTYKISKIYRGPVALDMNENYIVAGLDAKHGRSGAVLVLKKINGKWKKAYYIKSPKPDKDDLFGFSLALKDNKLLVGAKRYKYSGIAFLFTLYESKYITDHIFEVKDEENFSFGDTLFITKDKIIISDPAYYGIFKERDKKGKIIHLIAQTEKSEGAIYFYDKTTYILEKQLLNNDLHEKYTNGNLCTNGVVSQDKIIITDNYELYFLDEKKFILKKIWTYVKDFIFSFSGNDYSSRNYAFYGNTFIIGDGIYKLDGELKKLNTIKLKCNAGEDEQPFGIYCMNKDLLLCTDNNCDNYVKRKNQEIEGRRKGYGWPEIELPINKGRVHFLRLFPDGSYEEEAIIARRTNSKGKIEFYDMLHERKCPTDGAKRR